MCNLRLPFEAQHYNALAMKILQGSYPSIMPTYSKQLRDLIASMLSKKPQDRPSIIDVLNKPFVRTRLEKYTGDLLNRSLSQNDMDDIYLDTLREQAIALGILGSEEEGIKKYPSLKDLEKKQLVTNKSLFSRRSEEEDLELMSQYHSKRKSTFEKESLEKQSKKDEASSSFKALNLAFDISDEKEAFVDHKRTLMMERSEGRKSGEDYKDNARRFTIY
jgi:serine/threonine protein kinase